MTPDITTTRLLLRAGANANIRDKKGDTPLMSWERTTGETWEERAAVLIFEGGANVNAKNNDGQTFAAIIWRGRGSIRRMGGMRRLVLRTGIML